MAMEGATKNYKFGQKNNWRRTMWNEVIRRLKGRENREVILYLAGPQDLDRHVAVDKGVPDHNLIAIDRSHSNVDCVRDAGNSAICADALEVLRAWPKGVRVCAIVLDFCCGLLPFDQLAELVNIWFLNGGMRDAVLVVNFMRGRESDADTKIVRATAKEHCDYYKQKGRLIPDVEPLHRGWAFCFSAAVLFIEKAALLSQEQLDKEMNQRMTWMNPKFYSYSSGNLRFDSAVVDPISHYSEPIDPSTWQPCLDKVLADVYPKDVAISRKISATLAVRTRRARA
jgi:hypothetical protein